MKCNVTIQWGILNLCFRQRSKSKVGICVLVHTTPLPYTHLSWPHLPILTWKTKFFLLKFRLNYFHMHNILHNCTYATSRTIHTQAYTHINECTRKVKSHLNLLRLQTFYRPLVHFLYQHLRKDELKMNMSARKTYTFILRQYFKSPWITI